MTDGADPPNPARRFSLLTFVPVVVAVAIGGAFYWGIKISTDTLPSTLIGRPVPDFVLPPIEGRQDGLANADLRGKVSLVNVWSSWCVPCRAENPLLVALSKSGIVPIYGLNYKDKAKDALGFLAQFGDPYRQIGADTSGRVAVDWGIYSVPETYVIDADGRIAFRQVGPIDSNILDDGILPMVARLQAGDVVK
ncbi:MAG: DsbE family thiol:disulfide interchange protein [Paracoccaceae bacterium]